jgi:L-idonate 5-dehydrogenase
VPAVVVHGVRDLRIDDVPDRSPGPGEVKIRVRYGGICGSDLHYLEAGEAGGSKLREPLILGHELAGEITELGAGVDSVRLGQRAVVAPETPSGGYLGSAAHLPHVQGGFRQRLVVAAEQVVPVADGLPLSRAVLAEPLAVALHALSRLGEVRDATVLVVGLGPIGLLTVAALRQRGAGQVIARDIAPAPLELARSVGADRTELSGASDEQTQVGAAIECSGSAPGLADALRRTRRGGRIVAVGLPGERSSALDLTRLVTAEIELAGSFRFAREILDAVDLLASNEHLSEIVTATFPIRLAADAFAQSADRAQAGKILLEI